MEQRARSSDGSAVLIRISHQHPSAGGAAESGPKRPRSGGVVSRKPVERVVRSHEPRQGRKKASPQPGEGSVAPTGLVSIRARDPTACAVGHTLTPLAGLVRNAGSNRSQKCAKRRTWQNRRLPQGLKALIFGAFCLRG